MSLSPKQISNFIVMTLLVMLVLQSFSTKAGAQVQRSSSALPGQFQPDGQESVPILAPVSPFSLTDHTGATFSRADLYGRVWVQTFGYTRCTDPCSVKRTVIHGLSAALKGQSFANDVHFVSISVDPKHDTPKVLADYLSSRGIENSRWHFLTDTSQQVWDLSKLGLTPVQSGQPTQSNADIAHNAGLLLVDWEGRIRGYYEVATQKDLDQFKSDLIAVVDERTGVPASTVKSAPIDPRKQQQHKLAQQLDLIHDFTFSNQIDTSGISFRHKIIDDVGISYKAVHYDHGNAIAIADVDLDGLQDIYFTTLSGTNELWRNLGDGKFENITKDAGLIIVDRIGMGASFADIDNDGDPDLYITSVRVGNQLFENNGKGQFRDITKLSGTAVKAHSSTGTFFDYDRDGLLDLFVTNVGKYTSEQTASTSLYGHDGQQPSNYEYYVGFNDAFAGHLKPERAETSVLFKNLGNNRFEDVTEKANLVDKSWAGDAIVIDGNDDGWPDLYVLNMQGNDQYYENSHGKRFVRKSRSVFPETPWGAMGAKAFDYDNDGDIDLYITDMHSDMRKNISIDELAREKEKAQNDDPESFLQSGGKSIFGNTFYRNDGNGKYAEISDQIGVENYWPWGPSAGDLNADGFEDLFVASSMAYPFRYSINSVLLNNQGKGFVDSEFLLGVEPRKNGIRSAPWFEVDCAGKDRGHIGCYDSVASGRTVVWGAVGTRSSVIFDLDLDGDQDIVTLEFNQPPMVLISSLADNKQINYLKVNLVGKRSNRNGLGATVTVSAGEDVYTKTFDGKSGYLSQSLYPLYFGLGDNKRVKSVEVVWPSGIKQTITQGIVMNDLLVVVEPQ